MHCSSHKMIWSFIAKSFLFKERYKYRSLFYKSFPLVQVHDFLLSRWCNCGKHDFKPNLIRTWEIPTDLEPKNCLGSQLEASSWWSCVLICAACHHRFIFGWVTLLLCQALRSCKCFQKTCEPSCDLHSPTAETRSTRFCKPAHVRFLLLSVLLSRHSKYSQNLLWDDWWLGFVPYIATSKEHAEASGCSSVTFSFPPSLCRSDPTWLF